MKALLSKLLNTASGAWCYMHMLYCMFMVLVLAFTVVEVIYLIEGVM